MYAKSNFVIFRESKSVDHIGAYEHFDDINFSQR